MFDGELIFDRVLGDALETLNEAHVFAWTSDRILAVEIRAFNYKRFAFPMSPRVANPLPDISRVMWTGIQWDHSRFVVQLEKNHYVARRLNDLIVAVVCGRQ